LTYQPYEGKIIYQKNLTDDLAIFRLELSDKSKILDFKPGQFVPLGVKIKDKVVSKSLAKPDYLKSNDEVFFLISVTEKTHQLERSNKELEKQTATRSREE